MLNVVFPAFCCVHQVKGNASKKFTYGELVSHKIDQAAMVIFPLTSIVFFIAYWVTYASA